MMPNAPLFDYQATPTATQGWNGVVDGNMAGLRTHLALQPTCVKRVYREAASQPADDYPDTLALVNFAPGNFQGCLVYVMDPEGAEKAFAYSDGSSWLYLLSDNPVTIS